MAGSGRTQEAIGDPPAHPHPHPHSTRHCTAAVHSSPAPAAQSIATPSATAGQLPRRAPSRRPRRRRWRPKRSEACAPIRTGNGGGGPASPRRGRGGGGDPMKGPCAKPACRHFRRPLVTVPASVPSNLFHRGINHPVSDTELGCPYGHESFAFCKNRASGVTVRNKTGRSRHEGRKVRKAVAHHFTSVRIVHYQDKAPAVKVQ